YVRRTAPEWPGHDLGRISSDDRFDSLDDNAVDGGPTGHERASEPPVARGRLSPAGDAVEGGARAASHTALRLVDGARPDGRCCGVMRSASSDAGPPGGG